MKKILGILFVFALGFLVAPKNQAQAFAGRPCSNYGITTSGSLGGPYNAGEPNTINFDAVGSGVANNEVYTFRFLGEYGQADITRTTTTGIISVTNSNDFIFESGTWTVLMSGKGIVSPQTLGWCEIGTYTVIGAKCTGISAAQKERSDSTAAGVCFYDPAGGGCLDIEHNVFIKSEVSNAGGGPFTGVVIQQLSPGGDTKRGSSANGILTSDFGKLRRGSYSVVVKDENTSICSYDFFIDSNCSQTEDSCQEVEPIGSPTSLGPDVFSLCDQIPKENTVQMAACVACTTGGEDDLEGIWTAIGCIKKDPQVIVKKLITVGLGIGGGFTLITFLVAGFIFSTSQGSPERVKNAKEMMTASVVGLVFIIFSVSILQFIGWSVLKIPGFGG